MTANGNGNGSHGLRLPSWMNGMIMPALSMAVGAAIVYGQVTTQMKADRDLNERRFEQMALETSRRFEEVIRVSSARDDALSARLNNQETLIASLRDLTGRLDERLGSIATQMTSVTNMRNQQMADVIAELREMRQREQNLERLLSRLEGQLEGRDSPSPDTRRPPR